jgi:DnaA family protein
MMADQLPLAMRWPAQQRFDSFFSGTANAVVLELARHAARDPDAPWVYLSGARGSGKTHLLIAACAEASERGRRAQYVSLRSRATAERIEALGGSDVLALDDVDALAGDSAAERALFDLYNRCKMEKSTLLFSAVQAPAQIGIALPDLVSRLSACAQGPLKALDDAERREVLRTRAQARGIELDDAALDWLFARAQRDLASLTALLDQLDRASLAAKRRITVPFLRSYFELFQPSS